MTNEELQAWSDDVDHNHDLITLAIHEWLSNLERRMSLAEGGDYRPTDEKARGRLLGLERRMKAVERGRRDA